MKLVARFIAVAGTSSMTENTPQADPATIVPVEDVLKRTESEGRGAPNVHSVQSRNTHHLAVTTRRFHCAAAVGEREK